MKKLIYTIIIPLTMVCCKSENVEQELQETEINETVNEDKKVNCLSALVTDGNLTDVFDYWRDIEGMDGVTVKLNHTQEHQIHCFDISKYTNEEMEEKVKSYY